jgi:hypothetical protein
LAFALLAVFILDEATSHNSDGHPWFFIEVSRHFSDFSNDVHSFGYLSYNYVFAIEVFCFAKRDRKLTRVSSKGKNTCMCVSAVK